MRRLGQAVTVTVRRGRPATIELEGGPRPVRAVLDSWLETGPWWEAAPRKRYYRVEVDGQLDLSLDESGHWRLEVAWD